MLRRLFVSSLLLCSLLNSGCAPTLRLSPHDEAVVLLPDESTASITGHFKRQETKLVWLSGGFSGDTFHPMDLLAKAAPNQPVRNVHFKQSVNWFAFALSQVAALAAEAAIIANAPDSYRWMGLPVYLGISFAVPGIVTSEVEGDMTTLPADIGHGRELRKTSEQ